MSAMASWALHVNIYEPSGAGLGYPVVQHVFYGRTKEEAKGYFDAHMGTDRFMSACVLKGNFEGSFDCNATWNWTRPSGAVARALSFAAQPAPNL